MKTLLYFRYRSKYVELEGLKMVHIQTREHGALQKILNGVYSFTGTLVRTTVTPDFQIFKVLNSGAS